MSIANAPVSFTVLIVILAVYIECSRASKAIKIIRDEFATIDLEAIRLLLAFNGMKTKRHPVSRS